MPPNTPVSNSENQENQIFRDTSLSVKGKKYIKLNELPPELQDKLNSALGKMQNNPGLAHLLSSVTDLAKSALQNGIGISQLSSSDHAKLKNALKQHLSGKENILSDNSIDLDLPVNSDASTTISQTSSTPASFEDKQFLSLTTRHNIPTPSSTYNPLVRGDGLRKVIFIVAIALLVGYLTVKFVYNGNLPF